MAKFKYIGDRERGDCLGYEFPQGIGVEITRPEHIKKLQGNSHFQEVKPEPEPAQPEKPVHHEKAAKHSKKVSHGDTGANQVAGAE